MLIAPPATAKPFPTVFTTPLPTPTKPLFNLIFLKGLLTFCTILFVVGIFLGIDGALPILDEEILLLIFTSGLIPLFKFFKVLLLNFVLGALPLFTLILEKLGTFNFFGIYPVLSTPLSIVFPNPVFSSPGSLSKPAFTPAPVAKAVPASFDKSNPPSNIPSNPPPSSPEPLPSFSTSFFFGNFIPASALLLESIHLINVLKSFFLLNLRSDTAAVLGDTIILLAIVFKSDFFALIFAITIRY